MLTVDTDSQEKLRQVAATSTSETPQKVAWMKRLSEAQEASSKRLETITKRELAPSHNVKNYTNAFKEHALAIGVVDGINRVTARNDLISNHGPRLSGITYSDEEGFNTPHTLLTYINERSNKVNKYLAISDKTLPEAPFAIKFFSPDSSEVPATRLDPATRVLVFDFDQKDLGEEVIKSEVLSLCTILHNAGMYNWIVDVSRGGYHVLLMLNKPVLLSDVSGFFNGIREVFKSLDIQPMTFPNGAISVPYSIGKVTGSRRVLAHPKNEYFIHQRRSNKYDAWDKISESMLRGFREYDRVNLKNLSYDQHAASLSKAASEAWTKSISICHVSKSRKKNDHLALEQNHLKVMQGKTYRSASEERFSIAGAMISLYGFNDEAFASSSQRLKTSRDPLPTKYRELVKRSSGKITLGKAISKDLTRARETSTHPRGWVGALNGSSYAKIAVNESLDFTPEVDSLASHLIGDIDARNLDYSQLAILRSYLQYANARHHEHLKAIELKLSEVPENPFDTAVPFALSMVTRLTGLKHSTAYDRTMSCFKSNSEEGMDGITSCRTEGHRKGLFCECHSRWAPYFTVAHLGHSGDEDEGNRAHECRDASFCTQDGGDGKQRSSTYVQFKSYPERTLSDEQRESWVYRYLLSRDPIFNESALGAAGFHLYTLVSSNEKTYVSDLTAHKLGGSSAETILRKLIEAGLVGRAASRGANAYLTANSIMNGSLTYRLRHERRLHAVDQDARFRSAMMGTGDITQFVLGFSNDLSRLYAVAARVLSYASDHNEHQPADLLDPEGSPVYSVEDFCRAHNLTPPQENDQSSYKTSIISAEPRKLSKKDFAKFSYVEGEVESWNSLDTKFDEIHFRDDFIATARLLQNLDKHLFGSEFAPSKTLSEMFTKRQNHFIHIQEYLAEQEQQDHSSPPDYSLAA